MTRAVVVALVAGLAGGCLYLDGINRRPEVAIEAPSGPTFLGDAVTFRARVRDDQAQERLDFRWQVTPRCDGCAPLTLSGVEIGFTIDHKVDHVVELVVTDPQGARGLGAPVQLAVANRAPTAPVLTLLTAPPLVVGRRVRLQVDAADPDGDPLALTLEPLGHPADAVSVAELEREAERVVAFTPDVDGTFRVAVRVDDGALEASAELPVAVAPDRPPCLGALQPAADERLVVEGTALRRVEVISVVDDLDPLPPGPEGGATLVWALRVGAEPFSPLPGYGLPFLDVDPAAHSPGDVLSVRVEARDRVARPLSCPEEQRDCALEAGCAQRRTWELELR